MKIGNDHLPNEKLLCFVVAGSENINKITSITQTYSNKPSTLRKQLDVLIGNVKDIDVKRFIKEVSEAIPVKIPPK